MRRFEEGAEVWFIPGDRMLSVAQVTLKSI
jgi:hypothetical protein